jgi:hypothetical protein
VFQEQPPEVPPRDIAIVVETEEQRQVFEAVLKRLHARLS